MIAKVIVIIVTTVQKNQKINEALYKLSCLQLI